MAPSKNTKLWQAKNWLWAHFLADAVDCFKVIVKMCVFTPYNNPGKHCYSSVILITKTSFSSQNSTFLANLNPYSCGFRVFFLLNSSTDRAIAVWFGLLTEARFFFCLTEQHSGKLCKFSTAFPPVLIFRRFFISAQPLAPTGKILHRLHSLEVITRRNCLGRFWNPLQDNRGDHFTPTTPFPNRTRFGAIFVIKSSPTSEFFQKSVPAT